MIDNRLVEDIQLKLKALHFFEPLHGRIYDAILRMTDKNMVANPVTLRPIFDADEAMKEVGGPAYLAQLTGSGAAIIGARDFATQIYDLALLRALIGVGRELVEGALDTSEEVAPLAQIERAETELYKVAEEGGNDNKVKSFGEATRLALEMAERALNSGGHLSGVTTGIDGINSKIGGLHRSDLTILAGRPGMGKTSLATNIAFSAAQRFSRDIEDGIDPRNVGRPTRHAHPRRAVGDFIRKPPHGQDQPAGFPQSGARGGRTSGAAAIHRRHARSDHRRAARPRPAIEAPEGHRHGRR
jgi:replicative DNA helicase